MMRETTSPGQVLPQLNPAAGRPESPDQGRTAATRQSSNDSEGGADDLSPTVQCLQDATLALVHRRLPSMPYAPNDPRLSPPLNPLTALTSPPADGWQRVDSLPPLEGPVCWKRVRPLGVRVPDQSAIKVKGRDSTHPVGSRNSTCLSPARSNSPTPVSPSTRPGASPLQPSPTPKLEPLAGPAVPRSKRVVSAEPAVAHTIPIRPSARRAISNHATPGPSSPSRPRETSLINTALQTGASKTPDLTHAPPPLQAYRRSSSLASSHDSCGRPSSPLRSPTLGSVYSISTQRSVESVMVYSGSAASTRGGPVQACNLDTNSAGSDQRTLHDDGVPLRFESLEQLKRELPESSTAFGSITRGFGNQASVVYGNICNANVNNNVVVFVPVTGPRFEVTDMNVRSLCVIRGGISLSSPADNTMTANNIKSKTKSRRNRRSAAELLQPNAEPARPRMPRRSASIL